MNNISSIRAPMLVTVSICAQLQVTRFVKVLTLICFRWLSGQFLDIARKRASDDKLAGVECCTSDDVTQRSRPFVLPFRKY